MCMCMYGTVCLSKLYLTKSVPEHLLQWLQMINGCWHKHKHWEAQTEWDRWRQIEAEGEAQVKYPHINIADAVDNRPLKALLFHRNHLPQELQEYNLYKREGKGETFLKHSKM